ncbi:MAG: hypothetical protein PUB28_11390 [Roseburia sp.]|nr:hypothetical protein [Roseburia sp.]MDY5884382.1 hypothetical protein [Roseburia sp.]
MEITSSNRDGIAVDKIYLILKFRRYFLSVYAAGFEKMLCMNSRFADNAECIDDNFGCRTAGRTGILVKAFYRFY